MNQKARNQRLKVTMPEHKFHITKFYKRSNTCQYPFNISKQGGTQIMFQFFKLSGQLNSFNSKNQFTKIKPVFLTPTGPIALKQNPQK